MNDKENYSNNLKKVHADTQYINIAANELQVLTDEFLETYTNFFNTVRSSDLTWQDNVGKTTRENIEKYKVDFANFYESLQKAIDDLKKVSNNYSNVGNELGVSASNI